MNIVVENYSAGSHHHGEFCKLKGIFIYIRYFLRNYNLNLIKKGSELNLKIKLKIIVQSITECNGTLLT